MEKIFNSLLFMSEKRLLIITQKIDINDPVLGFFHNWIYEFAKNFSGIVAICLERGDYDLLGNVKVLSLGKEKQKSRLKYLILFYKYIWQENLYVEKSLFWQSTDGYCKYFLQRNFLYFEIFIYGKI